ncbi:unnamed protein product, partial [Meganyctiphanes norvegica]
QTSDKMVVDKEDRLLQAIHDSDIKEVQKLVESIDEIDKDMVELAMEEAKEKGQNTIFKYLDRAVNNTKGTKVPQDQHNTTLSNSEVGASGDVHINNVRTVNIIGKQ